MMRAVEAHSCRRHSPAGQCGAPFFCALDALAIDDRSARAGVPPRQLPACHIEHVVNAPERAVVVPSVEVVVQGAARRQVLGDRGPLAARAQDVHETVGHLAQVDRPLVAAALGGRDQRGDQRPVRVGQVTWVAQLATVVAPTVLFRPHQRLPPDRTTPRKSQPTPNTEDVPGWTLTRDSSCGMIKLHWRRGRWAAILRPTVFWDSPDLRNTATLTFPRSTASSRAGRTGRKSLCALGSADTVPSKRRCKGWRLFCATCGV